MKKFLSIILCLVLAFSTLAAFVACNPSDDGGDNGKGGHDKHEFSTTWSKDDDYHWHAATCGDTDEVKDKAAHSYSWQTTTPASCEVAGEKTGTCICGATKKEPVLALNHNYGTWTPNGDGTHSRTCGNDSNHPQTENCDYADTVVDPTCTENGYTLHTCKVCKDEVKDTPVDSTGHDYVGGVCGNCGDVDETQITDAELIAALEENCKDDLLKAVHIGVPLRSEIVDEESWYVTTDSQSQITKVEYAFFYRETSTSNYYIVCSATFVSPVRKKDICNNEIGNVTYNSEYTLNYNPSIQETRSVLAEAILKTCLGGEFTTTSIRIIIDHGYILDGILKDSNTFTVAELTATRVQQYVIVIKETSNDAGYISNLQDASKYRISSQKSYEITGTKLIAEAE